MNELEGNPRRRELGAIASEEELLRLQASAPAALGGTSPDGEEFLAQSLRPAASVTREPPLLHHRDLRAALPRPRLQQQRAQAQHRLQGGTAVPARLQQQRRRHKPLMPPVHQGGKQAGSVRLPKGLLTKPQTRSRRRLGLTRSSRAAGGAAADAGVGAHERVRGADLREANTEEALLRMQEEFLAQSSRPSARVTRIAPRGAAAAPGAGGAAAAAAAGLLVHVQPFILLASPGGTTATAAATATTTSAAAGNGSNGGGAQQPPPPQQQRPPALSLQLLRLEALRAWRACAHHGISLLPLDTMYGSICHLLLPPLPPADAGTAKSAAAAVRQLTAAETYLLLAALVRHSVAVARGDATLGRSMLGPGAAGAIAAGAAAWLAPAGLRGVAAAAVGRCNLAEWLPPALAEKLVEALAAASFGDPLLAAHLATALMPAASPVVRLQVWNGLAAEKALHLLPPLHRCLGAPAQYLPPLPPSPPGVATQRPGEPPNAAHGPGPDPAFLAAVQRSLVEGDLDRALLPHPSLAPATLPPGSGGDGGAGAGDGPRAAGCLGGGSRASGGGAALASVSGEVAMQQLASYLLVRQGWPALERAWERGAPGTAAPGQHAGGGNGGGGPAASGAVRGGVPVGAALLGGLVRSARPEAVAQLVAFAEARCGVARAESGAVLAQTCVGDAALRERVRQVLALCGLV
ncbi:hypothetical protein TSOC_001035 [Tetrabaena socialis]|uniref:Uncharacterized protein n=1 Tax=Tetrabaena socialis TaxID=47790 RepID=A0A2J8AHX6_9CHLO|nr:hypothetical protein TSOC_001035 [Tetrabaena socialis]|eukprot:PNH12114.1 hypothetical protein TSOC_001035 [Tetrabaena socialis]